MDAARPVDLDAGPIEAVVAAAAPDGLLSKAVADATMRLERCRPDPRWTA